MFSRLPKGSRSTAAWRISIWTTVAFAVGSALSFFVVYLVVAKELRERSDAWLSGEAEVLAEVSSRTPRDNLYDRIVEEVAELAAQEVPDERNSKGQPLNSVFFLQTVSSSDPLWVGPGAKEAFQQAIQKAGLTPRIPQSVSVEGWKTPFRIVVHEGSAGNAIYLGLSERGTMHQMNRLLGRLFMVWIGMVLLGFAISYQSARRTLTRVDDITETVACIGSDDLGSRLPETPSYDEISRLAQTFNHMLDRIQASVSQLRAVTDGVAHDLKSPVTSIRGTLEVALSGDTDNRWRERVAEAIEGLDRLSQLLNTTLDLAEAEAGALRLDRETVDLSGLVKQHVDLYHPAMAERRHELVANLEQLVMVEVDFALMNRVIGNLLDNELTHLPEGCLIHLSVAARDGVAEIVIEDNGPGFPPEIGTHGFKRFLKGPHSPGHGLGLPLVEAVVHAHGGKVRISDQKDGARITVSLPIAVLQPA